MSDERKIVQVATNFADGWGPVHLALCNDGTVWEHKDINGWSLIQPIPQPLEKSVEQ